MNFNTLISSNLFEDKNKLNKFENQQTKIKFANQYKILNYGGQICHFGVSQYC